MARTERCRHLPKKVNSRWAGYNTTKVVDGNAHRQHHRDLVRQRVEKLFGGPKPDWSIFDPKHGTHHEYVTDKKKSYVYDFVSGSYKWDYRRVWTELPGSWRRNPERDRWDEIEHRVENEIPKPAESWHPYQKGGSGRNKKKSRSRGNRTLRHAVKQALPKYDAEEDVLPEQDELYSKWDL
jgi:hypothetical protein